MMTQMNIKLASRSNHTLHKINVCLYEDNKKDEKYRFKIYLCKQLVIVYGLFFSLFFSTLYYTYYYYCSIKARQLFYYTQNNSLNLICPYLKVYY